jgi:hypothetical protein
MESITIQRNRRSYRDRLRGLVVGFTLGATVAGADTLVARGHSYEGTFTSYQKNAFQFALADGKNLEEPRLQVESLTLTQPRRVMIEQAGKTLDVQLVGYQQAKFSIVKAGKPESVFGMTVQRIVVQDEPAAAGEEGLPAAPRPRTRLDIARVLDRRDLTPQQTAAVTRCLEARKSYDAFLVESTKLVAEMEQATGKSRNALLEALRKRKMEEQPVLRALEAAENAVHAAFPLGIEASREDAPVADPARAKTPKSPAGSTGDVFILDVLPLSRQSNLSEAQKAAIQAYQAAAQTYAQKAVLGADSPETRTSITALHQAQAALLKLFPDVTIE